MFRDIVRDNNRMFKMRIMKVMEKGMLRRLVSEEDAERMEKEGWKFSSMTEAEFEELCDDDELIHERSC